MIEFNYLGDLVDNANSFSNFSISELSHGYEASKELNHMADFSVIAYQKDKQLFIEFNYNDETVSEQKMELLAEKTMDSIDYFIAEFENNTIKATHSSHKLDDDLYAQVKQRFDQHVGDRLEAYPDC